MARWKEGGYCSKEVKNDLNDGFFLKVNMSKPLYCLNFVKAKMRFYYLSVFRYRPHPNEQPTVLHDMAV